MTGWCGALLVLLLCFPSFAGTNGEFRGTVVDGPTTSNPCLYVEGHDHNVRRVYIGSAKYRYDSDVPAAQRHEPLPKVLPAGTEVRVTAEQDDSGEWRAKEIEILKSQTPESNDKKVAAPTTAPS